MERFIFHIGMHKCASTTLQNQVLNKEPGFIGVSKELNQNPDINFGKQFQSLAPVGGRQFGSLSGVENWIEKLQEYRKIKNLDVERFIISSEFLCQSNKISKRPIIKFLQEINDEILGGNGIKIIIVFRNQADMMASNYAQISNTNHLASQRDFEKYIARNLKSNSYSYYDWGAWAEELVCTFGKNNVCILLMEEMQNLKFWEKLSTFIDAQCLKAAELHHQNKTSKTNSNKLSLKTWSLKPFDISKKAKVDVNKVKNFLAGFGLQNQILDKVSSNLISTRQNYLKWVGYDRDHQMESTINLTEEISANIREKYEDSNLKLAKILDQDISHLGY